MCGHRGAMEWIYDEHIPSEVRRAMEAMAEKDLDALTWLHERHPASQIGVSVLEAMVTGECSQLDLVLWLARSFPGNYAYGRVVIGAFCGNVEICTNLTVIAYPTRKQVKRAMFMVAKYNNLAALL